MIAALLVSILISSTEAREDLNSFLKNVWSPYCKGISLLECPSGKAEQLRDYIRAEHAKGKSIEEIQASLSATYGNQIRMEPSSGARGNLAYLIPWLVFVIVSIFVGLFWKARSEKNARLQEPSKLEPQKSEKTSEVLEEIEKRLS